MIYGSALRILKRPEDAEEVVCDVLLRAWRKADTFDPARGSLLAWLLVMTRSAALDRLRAVAYAAGEAQESLPMRDFVDSREPVTDPERNQRQDRLQQAMSCLPEPQRRVLELAYFEGLSQSEIAARTGEPLGTVKTRTRLAMQRMRDLLKGQV